MGRGYVLCTRSFLVCPVFYRLTACLRDRAECVRIDVDTRVRKREHVHADIIISLSEFLSHLISSGTNCSSRRI